MEKIWEWLKSHPYAIGGILAVSIALYFLFRANANSAAATASASQSAADQAVYNAQSSGGNPLYGGGGFGASVPITSTPAASVPVATGSPDSAPVVSVPPVASSPGLLDNLLASGTIPQSAVGGFTTNAAGVQTPIPFGMNNNSDFTPHAVVTTSQAAPEVAAATTVKPLYQTPLTVGGKETLL